MRQWQWLKIFFIIGALLGASLGFSRNLELRFAQLGDEDISGNNQVTEAGTELPKPLTVQVLSGGKPIAGLPVRFSLLSEPDENRFYPGKSARITDTIVFTDRLGFARTRVQLGTGAGNYRIRAVANGQELMFSLRGLKRNWLLLTLVEIFGGLALFLFGMYYGSKGLRRLAGNRLREALFSLTRNRFFSVFVGIVVTVIFQSSTAVISLLISLASSGLLTLTQSLGVILGADIGTTITVQLLSFQLFEYSLIVVFLGLVLMNTIPRVRDIGQALFGFGLVFYSLKVVLNAAEPLPFVPAIQQAVKAGSSHPILALLFALLLTALIRSSAATIGIVVGFSFAGLVELKAAIPFIIGANIGSALNAIVASWRTNTEARRIAAAQVLFKITVAIICLPFLNPLTRLFSATGNTVARQIANAHTLLNIGSALLFLPFLTAYQKLLCLIVPDKEQKYLGTRYLNQASLDAPELALAQVNRELLRMAELVQQMFQQSITVFLKGDKTDCRQLVAQDDQVDRLEEALTGYLARISQELLSPEMSKKTLALFYITDELEHIADIVSKNLVNYTRKKLNENLAFSEPGLEDIKQFHHEVQENFTLTIACLTTWDKNLAQQLVQKRSWGVERKRELHNRHLTRLSRGLKESLDTSTIHLDIIADLERANFHLSQIGAAILGTRFTTAPDESDSGQTESGAQA
ncbi:Na/Pi symporter [candidate division WOR-3 bacterium]|nr:Na/Pi symporter [candidate division WOR-3 bacterium]